MSEKQFEGFLVRHLKDWLAVRLKPGDRFQFRSTDADNTVRLLSALRDAADGVVNDEGTELSYLDVNGIKLLIAGHAEEKSINEGCYTDNYLAKLRDRVVDDQRALIMVHNSSLDTITNSTLDLARSGAIWSVAKIHELLAGLIDNSMANRDTSRCLLDHQSKMVASDGASIFGYRSLYESMTDGDLRFEELGLFDDPHLTDSWGGATTTPNYRQIERRLEDNRKLRSEIEFEIEHYPTELEDRLSQFGGKFVKDNFINSDNWKNRTYDEFICEIQKQKKQALEFVDVYSLNGNLQRRSKKETTAGKREQNVLLQVPDEQSTFQIDLKFVGARTEKSEFEIQPKKVEKLLELNHKPHGTNTTFTISGAMTQEPLFFSVRIKRELSSEQFKFQFLLLPDGKFCFDDIINKYLVKATGRGAPSLVIQSDIQLLVMNPGLESSLTLKDNDEVIDVNEVGTLDYQQIYDESDEVRFVLKNGATELPVQVEGESAKESLILPLLMDTSRARHMFNDEYYGVYKESKGTVVVENQEVMQLFLRKQLLDAEWEFVASDLICWDATKERGLPAAELKDFPELQSLYQSYLEFLAHFKSDNRRTLPSLEGWGPSLVKLAKSYVDKYLSYLESVELGKTLSPATKLVMKLGTASIRDTEDNRVKDYLTPFHPLILAYYLYLIDSIQKDGEDLSFRKLPEVTLKRLTARGLIPHLFDEKQQYSYTQTVHENAFWLEIVPREDSNFEYVSKLVRHKIEEFTETFSRLFDTESSAPVLINSVNNAENRELFRGLLAYYMEHLEEGRYIHVNLYDDVEIETEFDLFSEMATYDDIKDRYDLDKGKAKRNTDTIVDVLRTRLTFSKFLNGKTDEQAYAHLTFFKNNQVVDVRNNNIDKHLSGVACGGLLNGESSRSENEAYFTAFGLRGVDYADKPHLKIARLFGAMWRPSKLSSDSYQEYSAISLAVSDSVKKLLNKSYDSSVWVTIVDPKVTLKFFSESDHVILIHYSDQYTSSAGYDAITVTKQSKLYRSVLGASGESLIREFNAFNGEWLLQMVNDPQKEKLGKEGVIASYKAVSAMLCKSDICWVPLSVAEMIRVAGNTGLAMSDSDFSRHNLGIKQGAISDDVLFAGFKDGKLYLLPVESKAGARPNFDKARKQARELKTYMEDLLGQANLAGRLYRGLFVRQVLLQVDKYRLYEVFSDEYFDTLLSAREVWLEGDFTIGELQDYPTAIVIAHLNTEACYKESYEEIDGCLQAEIPLVKLDSLINTPIKELTKEVLAGRVLNIDEKYFLNSKKNVVKSEVVANSDGNPTEINENETNKSVESSVDEFSLKECNQLSDARVLLGIDQASGKKIYWEYGHPELANRHMIVFGRSGQGKTYCIQGLLMELAKVRVKSLIIDYTNGFLPNHLEPEFNEFAKPRSSYLAQAPLAISPFRKQSQDFGGVELEEKDHIIASRIASVFNLVYSTIGEQQFATLTNVIERGVARHGASYNFSSMLDDLYEEGKTGESLANKLSTMVKSNLFDEKESKNWDDIFNAQECAVNVIQLASFSKDIMQLATEFILWDLYAYACANGSKNIPLPIVLDEVQNLDHRLESPLGKMLTEGRKYGVSLILATQTLSMLSKEEQDRIFQAAHKLFFAPAETEVNTYAKLLEQSVPNTDRKMWIKRLSELKKGECISVGLWSDEHGKVKHSAKLVKVSSMNERLMDMKSRRSND
ncbi:DNA phosphorothioation-dependent restriction protein DptH [Bermanella marisrubri]|uniref:Helicase HerA central domain-containing protein n=1 Tax=Bermanella marisrubri TaxID=207949 RepID=Q1N4B0_9GAMM|nr:DNA phosphorothioation-dependent restriction protein DptH [Bermanella marisrubri]EAT12955.1 hypothetical protein RED65_14702 [Oceanobacter sp. RED65] [Bermanella marisrubri]QIZ82916.1 DNA phosphorothioation-dependent restriction protein DptH [Bermanella marisrubri]